MKKHNDNDDDNDQQYIQQFFRNALFCHPMDCINIAFDFHATEPNNNYK